MGAASRDDAADAAREFPPASLDGGPWRLSMGLHRLDEDAWLDLGVHQAELDRKAALLAAARDEVLATLPGSADAATELLELVVAHLSRHGVAASPRPPAADEHPIETASRLVAEDLCILERRDRTWRLTAACVCSPSRWSLREKLGASLAAIHDPVPGFAHALAGPSATFFDRLHVERPVWRSNWTLLDTDELHLPSPASRRPAPPPADLGGALWFRVERQTLRRLARTGAVVFTIRTTVQRLDEAVTAGPHVAAALRATLQTVPEDVARYKGWTSLLAPLDAWLEARAHPGPAR